MIKALIFDFDGLILDTETPWYHAYQKIVQEQFEFELPLEEYVKSVGATDLVLFAYLEKALNRQVDIDSLRESARALHVQAMKEMGPREGVVAYLKEAKERNLGIALATSSTRAWAEMHLENLGLLSYFDHLITSDDVKHVKPAPDLYLKAMDKLNVKAHEAVVFEDSLNGLIAASKAKLATVIVPNPLTANLPFENYHLKLRSMEEMSLGDVIQSITKNEA